MNVYLDTATEDFVLVLFDKDFNVVDFALLEGYKKKVQLITEQFQLILSKNNLTVDKINNFYINKGPGFFTGVRSSLVYFRTFALLFKKPLFTIHTFEILETLSPNKENFYIDAQGSKVYFYDKNTIQIADKDSTEVDKVDYKKMIDSFKDFKDKFKEENTMSVEPLYIKQPQIGGVN
ncbi:tRNA (adenosine(37)-N6)-threonylcarbamoyltransferase complex dimerization subunit type 1 TsaB [Mycoplasma sp. 1232]|uniref:tRNA (adenosine(37)-N6)-threonylcarbamoyltransferase complex dimerization subunit type 1 TsaB n=1 Tax=Mycoplasma sp. 1232 TaxID=3108527 RepID=UPI002B260B61|nr:tRNA (adenosine(37)-N6)-threonylcarbamoyltransferase complex dimerization subunit type 1 TsaB [Mycoplasma sp. 1232]MEA4333863.1 tRNA (adenosine(37)-N6)-threonylcarbamoyltransferase complex dimerization subunit type 1 TsaB [Mycoplasma sp. 1232]